MKQDAPKPRKKKEIELFVARSGPRKGKPECEAAFETKDRAVDFLASLHGLEIEEVRKLAKDRSLSLNRKWHGAEVCSIEVETMSPAKAKHALSGELYAPKVNASDLPTPRAISLKTTLNVKLKARKSVPKRERRKTARKAVAQGSVVAANKSAKPAKPREAKPKPVATSPKAKEVAPSPKMAAKTSLQPELSFTEPKPTRASKAIKPAPRERGKGEG